MTEIVLPAADYDLAATLTSGQAFRWTSGANGWESTIGNQWVRLRAVNQEIHAITWPAVSQWDWLKHYLQSDLKLEAVLETFPADAPMQASVQACRGLRLLRQDPWECLASFILSSTKQIVQIRQICHTLCQRYGEPIPRLDGAGPIHCFPSAQAIAARSEAELRDCKMGFRAPSLLYAARAVCDGSLRLSELGGLPLDQARSELCGLRGVGPKIADCVLLFAYGFPQAFPVDVWIQKAIQKLYFKGRRVRPDRMERFVRSHFGPHSGYAQQYLFHYMRTLHPDARGTNAGATVPLSDPAPRLSHAN
ncbi:MAG: hypothetical protein JNN07_07510 [Verrucomicrobiales bacterium]|nr:hypothetical protein [Verrucomicrobiales bacterium]